MQKIPEVSKGSVVSSRAYVHTGYLPPPGGRPIDGGRRRESAGVGIGERRGSHAAVRPAPECVGDPNRPYSAGVRCTIRS